MVTVRDIASKACVSTATVSRVLNDMPNVSVPTRQIVIEAAKELGYPLDRFAISGHISKSVLLLVRENALIDNSHLWDTAGEFERCTMMGVKSVFDNKGISTRLQRIEDFSSSELAGILANDISIAGVLILGGVLNREFINELTSAGVKLAVVGAEVKGMNVSSIKADYLGGMYKAVNHLASSGRKRIGLINGPQTTTSSLEKEDGYRLGLARNGLDFSPSLIFQGSFGFESGYQETIAMLDKVSDIDAIAYAEDFMAIGGLRALKEAGITVPNEIAVTGFYNYESASFATPPLTSVGFDKREMGIKAAWFLNMIIEEPCPDVWNIVLPTVLKVRDSSQSGHD